MWNHIESIARQKLNESIDWQICVWERVGDGNDCLVKGAVPRLLTRGKRKGEPTWRGIPMRSAVVTQMEINAELEAFEAGTGYCAHCFGSGQTFKSWNHETGTVYQDCPQCDGTGLAKSAE